MPCVFCLRGLCSCPLAPALQMGGFRHKWHDLERRARHGGCWESLLWPSTWYKLRGSTIVYFRIFENIFSGVREGKKYRCSLFSHFLFLREVKSSLLCLYFIFRSASSVKPYVDFKTMSYGGAPVRRLSTASSVLHPPHFILTTQWVWYWKDENGLWLEYGKVVLT